MGRKSLAAERKSQIIQALTEVIRESGYEATTLELVASKAGVQRTLIRHYFGNRDQLITTALTHITEKYLHDYQGLVERFPTDLSVSRLLDYLFGGKFNERPKDDQVIDALIAASYQNEAARASLRGMYQIFEETVAALLLRAFPLVEKEKINDVAYAVMCLAEQHATLHALGVGAARDTAAKRAAKTLIDSLMDTKANT